MEKYNKTLSSMYKPLVQKKSAIKSATKGATESATKSAQ